MPKRKKRRRSWGSITTVSRDRHVLRYTANTPEGRKRVSRTFYGTYKEADLELSRLRVAHSDDKPVPTVGEAYRMWYEPWLMRRLADGKTKARTVEIYEGCWRRIVEPRWGSVPVCEAAPADVQSWIGGLSASNAKVSLVILRKIGSFAVRFEVSASNKFALDYEMPTMTTRSKRSDKYSLEEADAAFSRLLGRPTEPPFILACFGSARTGESLAVRPEEVELAESHGIRLAVVPIVRRMGETGSLPLPDGDLKNPQSRRVAVIPEPYGTRLWEIAQERLAYGVGWLADRGDGLPFNRMSLGYAWKVDAGRMEIPFSNLRTSWRTFAQYSWGVDYDTLEILMGHALGGVTGKHYLKPTPADLVDAVAKAVVQSRRT